MPRVARGITLFIGLQVAALVPALWAALQRPGALEPRLLGLLLLAAAVTGTWRVSVTVLRGKQSLVFAVACLASLLQGAAAAILCAAVGALVTHLARPVPNQWWKLRYHPEPFHRRLFNVAHCSLVAALAAVVQDLIRGGLGPGPAAEISGLAAFASVYFLLNTLGVSTAIALDQGGNPVTVWRQNYLWMAPAYFACAATALGLWAGYLLLGFGFLFLLPALYLVFLGFRTYADALTSARKLSQEVDRLYRQEEEANRRKDEFLAMLGHELRNPLAAISNSQYLLECGDGDPTRHVRLIGRQVRHLRRLIDDLLDISRITRGTLQLRREEVDLRVILQSAVEATGALYRERAHELKIVAEEGPLPAYGDPARLEQVFTNLLVNAARYSPAESPVLVRVRRESGFAVCSVRDAGIGIPPEEIERIFDLFVQGERPGAHGGEGLGLGLSLVRTLIEMHGGTVSASSEGVGRGAEFTVRIPLSKAPADQPLHAPDGAAGPDARPGDQRVLLVEDNADAAETLVRMLEGWGYQPLVARNGREGIRIACRERPPVTILDIGLPDTNGYEVARSILKEDHAARLVALTGFAGPEDQARAREAGFAYHLSKPADPAEVQRVLKALFSQR